MSKQLIRTNQFKRDFKLIIKRGYDLTKFEKVLGYLISDTPLPLKYKDHQLAGNLRGIRDLHIEGDWLLLYENNPNEITLHRTGTHTDIFKNIK